MLNTNKWKPFKINTLFDIHPTKAYANLSKEELDDGGTVPFVVNSAEKNGVGGFSTLEATETGGIITFSDTTNGDTFFYQPKDFIGFAHVQGMYPITREWNENELLFIITILRFVNIGRYNYGRKMTRENISNTFIDLPVDVEGNIDFAFINEFMESVENAERESKGSIRDSLKSINKTRNTSLDIMTENWKDFYLHKLFKTRMGNGIDAVVTTNYNPKYNYVSRDSNGNGVVGFVDEIEGEGPFPAGTMSLALGGSFLGSCFIQNEPFYTAQNVGILQEKESLSIYSKLFITTLIRNECKVKYQAFGRELNSHFRKDFTVKLPIKMNGLKFAYDENKTYSDDGYIPDWEWMENYIRELPYADKI